MFPVPTIVGTEIFYLTFLTIIRTGIYLFLFEVRYPFFPIVNSNMAETAFFVLGKNRDVTFLGNISF